MFPIPQWQVYPTASDEPDRREALAHAAAANIRQNGITGTVREIRAHSDPGKVNTSWAAEGKNDCNMKRKNLSLKR